jgi:catechol 2,3-dioxygenase-like lactoylglutathione lyase family enzyme
MINGAHVIIYSRDAEADRAFIRDVLGFPGVDAGGGWLIFALPPAEVAVHPAEVAVHPAQGASHELYLMCDDIEQTIAELAAKGVKVSPAENAGWGIRASLTLPGGSDLAIYQPRHATAQDL